MLGLGAANLVWIDLYLGPRVLSSDPVQVTHVARALEPVEPVDSFSDESARGSAGTVDPTKDEASAAAQKDAAREVIYFDSMSSRVGSSSRAKLAEVAKRAGVRGIIHLEGHTDYRGDATYNEQLSKWRVDNVGGELIKQGVDAARIVRTCVGEGSANEVIDTELWRDRRVDIWIKGGPE